MFTESTQDPSLPSRSVNKTCLASYQLLQKSRGIGGDSGIQHVVGIGYGSCQRILTEQLNMHRIAAKSVPRVLTQDQKDSRVAIFQELKETVMNDPTILLNVITGDESIVYAYDPETKLQSSQWKSPGSPRPKKHICKKAN